MLIENPFVVPVRGTRVSSEGRTTVRGRSWQFFHPQHVSCRFLPMQIPTVRVHVDCWTMCSPDVFFTQEVLMAAYLRWGKHPMFCWAKAQRRLINEGSKAKMYLFLTLWNDSSPGWRFCSSDKCFTPSSLRCSEIYFIPVQGAWSSDHHEVFMLWEIVVHRNAMKRSNLYLCLHTSLLRGNPFEEQATWTCYVSLPTAGMFYLTSVFVSLQATRHTL